MKMPLANCLGPWNWFFPANFLFKACNEATKVNGYTFMCEGYRFCVSTIVLLDFGLFRLYGIFSFSFMLSNLK